MIKSSIRSELLRAREMMNPMSKDILSNTIFNNLINLQEFYKAHTVFLYASKGNEVDTTELIEYCLKQGKRIALPCSYMTNGLPKMEFYTINSRADLIPGYKGIYEPDRRKTSVKKTEEMPDAIIVPGVAFDYNLNRVGYGKGFYDSYFNQKGYTNDLMKPYLIGLCYDFQTAYDIAEEPGDVKMNIVVTENGYIYGKTI